MPRAWPLMAHGHVPPSPASSSRAQTEWGRGRTPLQGPSMMFGAGWGLGTSPSFHLDFPGHPGTSGGPQALPVRFSPAQRACPGAHFPRASLGGQGSVGASLVTPALPSLALLMLPELVCACCTRAAQTFPLPLPLPACSPVVASFHTFPRGPARSHLLLDAPLTIEFTFINNFGASAACRLPPQTLGKEP